MNAPGTSLILLITLQEKEISNLITAAHFFVYRSAWRLWTWRPLVWDLASEQECIWSQEWWRETSQDPASSFRSLSQQLLPFFPVITPHFITFSHIYFILILSFKHNNKIIRQFIYIHWKKLLAIISNMIMLENFYMS